MEKKTNKRNGAIGTIWLTLIVFCLLTIMAYQVQTVSSVLNSQPSATPTQSFYEVRETLAIEAPVYGETTPTVAGVQPE